ncbi:MAG: SMI1/KNR4 family protein [Phycisphaerales bacterium]|nr:SMI1/KNR4 family protein [Phycisphaerales bacterium]MCB9857087.1 SMI1/KNR4 family protein [Phycisphaerales bacterium]MCB9861786.1 SMI1/KNR4 family protein [Phycisphaerales bacterium]
MLRFHEKTFRLIGTNPNIDPSSLDALAAVEQRIGLALPASLREWYSLEDACDRLYRYSNTDPSVSLSNMRDDGLIGGRYLKFRYESQGMCFWAVDLDGTDDPPVVIADDETFQPNRRCNTTFSEFVNACVWDWGLVLNNCMIQAQNAPLSEEAIAVLHNEFKAELQTNGWPGHTQYRFYSADQRILIWASEDQADWCLAGDSEDAVSRLAQKLWHVDNLGRSFWSHNSIGESMLQTLRARMSRDP